MWNTREESSSAARNAMPNSAVTTTRTSGAGGISTPASSRRSSWLACLAWKCPEHGVKTARVPWAEKHSRFTLMFERFAIDVLQSAQAVTGAMSILRTGWDQTWGVICRAVARGKGRKQAGPLPRVGIDEKAFKKGQSYLTLLYDLDNSTVEAISEGNNTESGNNCFSQLSEEQITSIEAIAMDMSAAYVSSAKQNIPLAETKIVHDRFHVMKLATEAVDKVRRGEHRRLQKEGDDRLSGTKYLWIKSQENLTDNQQARFQEAYNQQLETGKAWAYKEMLRDLCITETPLPPRPTSRTGTAA